MYNRLGSVVVVVGTRKWAGFDGGRSTGPGSEPGRDEM